MAKRSHRTHRLRCYTSTRERSGWKSNRAPRWGHVLEEIYGELCESTTTTPVFYTDFPKENSPLAREHRDDPRLAEKWDLVIFASEQGTAYSELTDPLEQRERLVAQSLRAAAGDPEAMQVDEDFLEALEYGMPPTGGMGMGIDRLVMNLTGLGIRETILFPLVKPQAERSQNAAEPVEARLTRLSPHPLRSRPIVRSRPRAGQSGPCPRQYRCVP